MKLRIKGNTIRLRLSKSEVNKLVETNEVWDSCQFINSKLKYGLKTTSKNTISADFTDNVLMVSIPKLMIIDWDKNDQISFSYTTENELFILIEKDFKCLIDRPQEIEEDMYENPLSKNNQSLKGKD